MKGKNWEREAYITYFENGKMQFSQNMGIRIKGAADRANKCKSFNIYSSNDYEGGKKKLKYELFKNNFSQNDGRKIKKYDGFSLRELQEMSRQRENLISQNLLEVKNLISFERKRCMIFLDGELWGLYDISERSSPYYFLTNFGIPEHSLSIIKNQEQEEGPYSDFEEMFRLAEFCQKFNLSEDIYYQQVAEKIVVDSFIKHYSVGLYVGTWDWPHNNYIIWRNNGEKIDGNPYSDGKWRFGSFDFDKTAGVTYGSYEGVQSYEYDYYSRVIADKDGLTNPIFIALLENREFCERFLNFLKL